MNKFNKIVQEMQEVEKTCDMIEKKHHVCLFGLSADPPTGESGHVGVVRAIIEMNEYDELHILPVFKHSFRVRAFP
jgi:hypothetical protein